MDVACIGSELEKPVLQRSAQGGGGLQRMAKGTAVCPPGSLEVTLLRLHLLQHRGVRIECVSSWRRSQSQAALPVCLPTCSPFTSCHIGRYEPYRDGFLSLYAFFSCQWRWQFQSPALPSPQLCCEPIRMMFAQSRLLLEVHSPL